MRGLLCEIIALCWLQWWWLAEVVVQAEGALKFWGVAPGKKTRRRSGRENTTRGDIVYSARNK
jgi:hypothetical protein